MAREAGIPLIELFETTDQVNQSLPGGIAEFFRRFVAIDLESRISSGAVIHSGKLQSFLAGTLNNDSTEFKLGFGTLRIPLVTNGIPFQLSQARAATSADMEPGADSWQFDVLINDLTLTLDGLIGADLVPAAATLPRHLVPKEGNPPVAITGSAGLRFEKAGPDQGINCMLFDPLAGSDPFVPMQPSGDIFNVTCTPPHFMIGKSQFGMTLKNIMVDTSKTYSPAFVLERGQPANWVGLAIEEAAVYLPPNALGGAGFSASIKDFLIGDPAGLQAELEIQFGRSPLQASTFVFRQDGAAITSGFDFAAGTLEITARPGQQVEIEAALTFTTPPAGSGIDHWEAEFEFPNQPLITGSSGKGMVRHDEILTITPYEVLGTGTNTRRVRKPPFSVRMVASGTAPAISVTAGTTNLSNVVDLSGPRDDLNGMVLTATATPADPNATFRWLSPALGIDQTAATLTLAIPAAARGIHHIAVTQVDSNNGASRVRLRIREAEEGALYIGCQAGVLEASAPTAPVAIASILGSYDLAAFHEKAVLNGASASASLSGSAVTVPAGVIAEVVINEGGAPAQTKEHRHVQLLFEFAGTAPVRWGAAQPAGDAGSDVQTGLLKWAADFPGAKFQIIGRCDDVGSVTYNTKLAKDRANAAKTFLTTSKGGIAAINASDVEVDGEQSIDGLLPGATPLVEADSVNGASPAVARWFIKFAEDRSTWPQKADGTGERQNPPNAAVENIRKTYRRVDVYAVGGTAQNNGVTTISQALEPTHRRILVPASGRAVIASDNDNSKADYRVKLVLGWDRARFTGWTDIIPNLAEFEYAWTPSPADNISLDSQVLTVYGKFIFDDLTGFTDITVGLKSEGNTDGLLSISQPNLVAALAFGPMLASGVDFDDDAFGSAVRLGALGAIAGFASVDLGDGPLVGAGSKTALVGVEAKASTRTIRDPLQSFKTQLTVDYTNTLHINGGVLGLKTDPNQPMKIRYSKIGIEFDNTDPNADLLDKVGFVYASDAMTIEDSGLWKITGPLGKLLRISEFKLGVGSFWVEPTLALAVNIGVVEISEASFRVTFDLDSNGDPILPPEFSLRGLKAKIDIPKTLTGEGRLKIEDNGVVRAGIDITIVPLKMRVEAALAFGSPPEIDPAIFLSLYAKVQFPGGIPLGSLPFAIHGFIGQTVINGGRDVANVSDVVAREIGWWRKDPEDKYSPEKGQHALGFGVVMGTLPDASFSLSVTGMVVVAFPDPEVILGVEVNLLSVPDTTAKDKKDGDTASITGLVVINTEAVTIAVMAEYEIPKVLKLKVPFGAYFPYPGQGENAYVRLGADGVNGRSGEPVTITFLPDTLNLKAWAYLMIEGGGIQSLGGEEGWDFDGFAIGFGAGMGIEWKAGPIGLSASAKMLVGLGTDPLIIKGGLFVNGKLDLVVVSIAARGDIVVTYLATDDSLRLEGEFCGEVDLFFFSLKGCVDFSVGTPIDDTPPPPPKPVKSVTLTDHMSTAMGEATTAAPQGHAIFDFDEDGRNNGVAVKDNHTVWPDTIPVVNFSHYIEDALANGAQFNPSSQPGGEPWFGSSRLKYAYRLDDVRLVKAATGQPVTDPSGAALLSAWTHSPSRAVDDTSGTGADAPSGAEVTHLQLLSWEPWAWARATEDGGEGQPGDPAETIERICEPVPPARPACLLGRDASVLTPLDTRLRRLAPAPGPYPSKFRGRGQTFLKSGAAELTGTAITTLLAANSQTLLPGAIVDIPSLAINGKNVTAGYRLPGFETTVNGGSVRRNVLPWRALLDRDVTEAELTLLVCQNAPTEPDGTCYQFGDVKLDQSERHFELTPFSITAQKPNESLKTTDEVDISNPLDPRFGQDNRVDMQIPNGGAVLSLKIPCRDMVLHYMRPGQGKVTFTVFHADGSKTEVTSDGPPSAPMETRLRSETGIDRIVIAPPGDVLFLYRVCCLDGEVPPRPSRDCLLMEALPKSVEGQNKFTFDGAEFSTQDPKQTFTMRDWVDVTQDPARAGQDANPELVIPSKGLHIKLPATCLQVEVYVMTSGPVITVTGLDRNGNKVAETQSAAVPSIGQRLLLTSRSGAISDLEINGGSGEAVLYRVCCLQPGDPAPKQDCIAFSHLPKSFDRQARAVHDGVTMTPLQPGESLRLADLVDMRTAPRPGPDGQAELLINAEGLVLTLPNGCRDLEIEIMGFSGEKVMAEGFDANGNKVGRMMSTGAKERAEILRLSARVPMVTIRLSGGADETVLLRICCRSGALQGRGKCIDFSGLKPRTAVSSFSHKGVTFRDLKDKKTLRLKDNVDRRSGQMKKGEDGVCELEFGRSGLGIDLRDPADSVSLSLFGDKGQEYKVEALDSQGKRISGEGGTFARPEMRLTLTKPGITRLRIRTQHRAALVELCTEPGKDRAETRGAAAVDAGGPDLPADLPQVSGLDRDKPGSQRHWPGEILKTIERKDGRICHLVRYRMPRGAAAVDQVSIGRSRAREIVLVGLCATDKRAALWRTRDEAVREELADTIQDAASATDGRPVILEADTEYRIEVDWSWTHWQGESDHDNAPAEPPANGWTAGGTQSFRFRTASEQTSIPTRQDGPNEYLFDPRDIERYLLESEPQNGAIAHFTDDPVVFHFSQNHMANLLDQYGREFDIEIRRTDPPPQPGGDIRALIAPLAGTIGVFRGPEEYHDPLDQRLGAVLKDLACLPLQAPPIGGVTLAGDFALAPRVMYDADLMARRKSNHSDKIRIQAANFMTSRYANPEDMVQALGCATDGSIGSEYPGELILESGATVPGDVVPASDMAFDGAMADMGLDTLGLPEDSARMFQIWQPDPGGSALTMVAVLLDALEPMNRRASVVNNGSVEQVDRCMLDRVTIDGVVFRVARLTLNSTRALLVPATAFSAPVNDRSFELHFSTNDGPLIGRRYLRTTPLTLELEGF